MGLSLVVFLLSTIYSITYSFECIGTCYTGPRSPEQGDVHAQKQLQGFTFKSVIVADQLTCYRLCTQDCRCKACQIQGNQCELLSEDRTTKPGEFLDNSQYTYIDIRQSMFQGKSHMLKPGVCHNGCCRSSPCPASYFCKELCQNPKEKFVCECPYTVVNGLCVKVVYSCLDVLKNEPTFPENKVYTIERSDKSAKIQVYCAFHKPNQAWQLIEAYHLKSKNLYQANPFHVDFPIEEAKPNFANYRMSLSNMKYLRTYSTLFRATCNFATRSTLTPDLLVGYLSNFDIINVGDSSGTCFKISYLNIRSHEFQSISVPFYSIKGSTHVHITTISQCGFEYPMNGAVPSEDNFGYYASANPNFTCSATELSGTEWWLGAEL